MTIRPCVRTDNAGMTMGHRYIADRFRFLLPFSVLSVFSVVQQRVPEEFLHHGGKSRDRIH